ncbi:MAG: sigma-70 family RNA polymerase sigma factor [Bacteroidota bacterium]|uniref:Sigma-70 family RNA polymerase sigma factor n=1 Tax=Flagellimonas profundi TaxID=2915620 RepID=A0ABS3FGX2_9FLAO|nr:sigma-70 family RNA polymerase sigma factor [Allomuricauda profundi]MBO0342418.1 sigma-70 family RNA polymerase sigma factor [Allomuricauda profundi]MEC7770878.1 sigma-70 family RNA polymerase sigma factor [Bacteroidota bacterium]
MTQEEPSICEQKTYNQIFRAHYEAVTRFVYYKCGDLQQAEDIVQDVFVKLWKLCSTVSFSKVKAYLYRAANNSFLNEVAHEKIVWKHLQKTAPSVDNENPEYLMQMDEFHEKLKTAIASLPQKEREVYLLSRVEKKTYSEIAEILGLGVKAIERRMSKALLMLRDQLGKELKF